MRLITASLAVVLLALSGCAVAEAQDPADLGADPAATQEPEGFDTDCIVGTWGLDTADFLAQSTEFLEKEVGAPLDSLDVEGGQTLVFAADGLFDIRTDLTWSGSILGNPFTVSDQSVGAGTWEPVEAAPSMLWFPEFAFIVPPGEAPAGSPGLPSPDPTAVGDVAVDCEGDDLVLSNPDGVLIGRFVRIEP